MSIPASTQPIDAADVALLAIMAAASPLGAWYLGVFGPRSIQGRMRLPVHQPMGAFVVVLIIGGVVWFGLQSAYLTALHVAHGQSATEPWQPDMLTTGDYAFLSTVPYVFGLMALLAGDARIARRMPARLGYAPAQLARAIGASLAGALIMLPLIWLSTVALQVVYRAIGYEHPNEHDLLRAAGKAHDLIRAAIIVGATLLAPAFEEMLFRGHLQTLIRRLTGSPWIAVILASVVFSLFHPMWMAPAIFLLSLGLGYAYERTGNLWVPILIHAVFNTMNTVMYLLLSSH